jgi:hypothetical protein
VAYGGLRAAQTDRGARKTALFDDREKGFKLGQVHK